MWMPTGAVSSLLRRSSSRSALAGTMTLTGSIGIYGGKFNLSGLYEKIGFHQERVSRGKSADFWSETRPFSEEERARFRRILEEGYRRFLNKVSVGRQKDPAEVDALGQGRVWTGSQALERGLVDELGGLERAVDVAKEKAGIAEDREVQLVVYPHKRSFFEMMWTRIFHQGPVGVGWEALDLGRLLERSPVLQLLSEGRPLALMPYQVSLR